MAELERRGIDLSGGRARQLLRTRSVASVMASRYAALAPDDDLPAIRAALIGNPEGNFVVLEEDGTLAGVLTMEDLKPWLLGEPSEEEPPSARDLAHAPPRAVVPGDNLATALEAMRQSDDTFLPVLKDDESGTLVGILTQSALLMAHNRALADAADERA